MNFIITQPSLRFLSVSFKLLIHKSTPEQRDPGWSQRLCAECHFGKLWAARRAELNGSHWRTCVALPLFPLLRIGPGVSLWGITWTAVLPLYCCSGQKLESFRGDWGQYTCTDRLEDREDKQPDEVLASHTSLPFSEYLCVRVNTFVLIIRCLAHVLQSLHDLHYSV